jgi:hypothetical protein
MIGLDPLNAMSSFETIFKDYNSQTEKPNEIKGDEELLRYIGLLVK